MPTQVVTLRWSGDGEFIGWRWERRSEPFEDGAARFAAERYYYGKGVKRNLKLDRQGASL